MSSRPQTASALNVPTQTLFIRDNLEVLRGFNSESVALIYLDPPFNSRRHYGSPAAGGALGAFRDVWTGDEVTAAEHAHLYEAQPALYELIQALGQRAAAGAKNYLIFMTMRLLEMHRILKPTGSLYLHVNPIMSHYLKCVMDFVFGEANFMNEIVWGYKTGGVPRRRGGFAAKHDVILLYAKQAARVVFNPLKSVSYSQTLPKPHTASGQKLGVLRDARVNVQYRMTAMRDWWVEYGINKEEDVTPLYRNNRERTGWPTQKPLALLRRIIAASSRAGDVVLDPFCGGATVCEAAGAMGREWVGIDVAEAAYAALCRRAARNPEAFGGAEGEASIRVRREAPVRTDVGDFLSELSEGRGAYCAEVAGKMR